MIKFHCENCGQGFSVPEIHVGKKAKCPKCKSILTVPKAQARGAGPGLSEADKSKVSPCDLTLLDVPREVKAQGQEAAEIAYEQLRRLQGGLITQQGDQILQRRLPWVIDIFFYPFSKPGLTTIVISVGIPFFLRVLTKFLVPVTMVFPPMLIFLVVFIIAHWASLVILILYIYWYVCACVRDSAAGGIRAPETAGIAPGLWDILSQTLKCLFCLAFFMSPALFYFSRTQRADPILWTLYGCGGLLFPMGLLAVVMLDSLGGLNPILVIRSMFSTFLPYCGLVMFFYGLCIMIAVSGYFLLQWWVLGYVFLFISSYQALIGAHLLGRFYWWYKDKLDWGL